MGEPPAKLRAGTSALLPCKDLPHATGILWTRMITFASAPEEARARHLIGSALPPMPLCVRDLSRKEFDAWHAIIAAALAAVLTLRHFGISFGSMAFEDNKSTSKAATERRDGTMARTQVLALRNPAKSLGDDHSGLKLLEWDGSCQPSHGMPIARRSSPDAILQKLQSPRSATSPPMDRDGSAFAPATASS